MGHFLQRLAIQLPLLRTVMRCPKLIHVEIPASGPAFEIRLALFDELFFEVVKIPKRSLAQRINLVISPHLVSV